MWVKPFIYIFFGTLLLICLSVSVEFVVLGFGSIYSGKLLFVHDERRRGEGSVKLTHLSLNVVEMGSRPDMDKHFSFPNC